MRIVKDCPERMVLRDRTLWVAIVCGVLGLGFAAITASEPSWGTGLGALIFLVAALAFFDSTDLVMDRSARTCDLRRMTFGRTRRWTLRFDEITDVRIERSASSRAGGPTYRLVFVTATESIPLTAALTSGQSHHEAMQAKVLAVLHGQAPPVSPPVPPPPQQADIVQPG
jgi:hypothetical protein